MTALPTAGARALYHRLPADVRRWLRPLELMDEVASFLPPAARAPLCTATEAARRLGVLRRLRFPVRRVAGTVDGTAVRCLFGMDDASARYWRRAVFDGEVREERCGEFHALEVARAAAELAGAADLALWRVPWPLGRALRSRTLVPAHVPFWLATDRPMDAIVHGEPLGRHSRKDDARRVRKLGLAVRVATSALEHERFRHELYEPYTRWRFGDLALPIPAHVFRQARRQGWLLLLERDGRTVAGAQLERWGRDARILAFGVGADGPLPSGLALAACYYHSIAFAVERGFRRLSLGTVRPVLRDGVLRYKRKWGATAGRPVTWDHFLLEHGDTAGARAALTAAPLIVQRGGVLAALVGAHGVDATAQREACETPGVSRLVLLAGGAAGGAPAGEPRA